MYYLLPGKHKMMGSPYNRPQSFENIGQVLSLLNLIEYLRKTKNCDKIKKKFK